MQTSVEKALKIFITHQGILQTSQALALGIAPRTLYVLRDRGLIHQLSRGFYSLADQPPLAHPDLVLVSLRIPKAVLCLLTAAHLHGLVSQAPEEVYIALPQSAEKPRLERPALNLTWLTESSYTTGLTTTPVDGYLIPIYSREKTVSDCFKFRNKIGIDKSMVVLKNYVHQPDSRVDHLLNFAHNNHEFMNLMHYLERLD